MEKNEEVVRDFALSRVGCGYVYGATGWVSTPERRARQAVQYPAQKDNILRVAARWDGKQCYDCAQLVRFALEETGVYLPSGATSQWKSRKLGVRGKIAEMGKDHVCIVYRRKKNTDTMQHTGLYLGDGTVVHAKSSAAGVVREKLGNTWTDYAALPDAEGKIMYVTAKKGSTVNLRKGPSKASAILARVPVGSAALVAQEGDVFDFVRAAGKSGYMMKEYLTEWKNG